MKNKITINGEEWEEISYDEAGRLVQETYIFSGFDEKGFNYNKYFKKVKKNPFEEILDKLEKYSLYHDTKKSWCLNGIKYICKEQLNKEKSENDQSRKNIQCT